MSNHDHTTKECNVCHQVLPITDEYWHKNKTTPDGYSGTCKQCALERARKWNEDNKKRSSERAAQYYQDNKEHLKAKSNEYYRNNPDVAKQKANERYHNNIESEREKRREYGKSHKEEHRIRSKRWSDNNRDKRREQANNYQASEKGTAARLRRRSRERALPTEYTHEHWQQCITAWDEHCAYCGSIDVKLTADHFIPLANETCPGTVPSNIVPCCKSCNSSKQDRDPIDWLIWKFGEDKANEVIQRITNYFDSL